MKTCGIDAEFLHELETIWLICAKCGRRLPFASGFIAAALRADPDYLVESVAEIGWSPDSSADVNVDASTSDFVMLCPGCGAKPMQFGSRYRRSSNGIRSHG